MSSVGLGELIRNARKSGRYAQAPPVHYRSWNRRTPKHLLPLYVTLLENYRPDQTMYMSKGSGGWASHLEGTFAGPECEFDGCTSHYSTDRTRDIFPGAPLGVWCFTCAFWLEHAHNPDRSRAVVDANWRHYWDTDTTPGHGGMWTQGVIPRRMRHLFTITHQTIDMHKRLDSQAEQLNRLTASVAAEL